MSATASLGSGSATDAEHSAPSRQAFRRWELLLARSVNSLDPRAKARSAMRILDYPQAFHNVRAQRLSRDYQLPVPSALLLGLEPRTAVGCDGCPVRRDCHTEGMKYRELARRLEEGRHLGIRLVLAVSENPGRYWAELLDLALVNPDVTFLVFAGDFVPNQACAAEAVAAGNLSFVLTAAWRDESREQEEGGSPAALPGADILQAAGAPFGFAACGQRGKRLDSAKWLESLIACGCLFGFCLTSAGSALQTALKHAAPIPLIYTQDELIFTDELRLAAPGRTRSLLVHPVTPRLRSLTLMESIEELFWASKGERQAGSCPLALDGGNTRGSLLALLYS